jgi:hypothetical protein
VFGIGTGFVSHLSGAQEQQVVQSTLVHEVEAGLVTMDEGEGRELASWEKAVVMRASSSLSLRTGWAAI